MIFPNVFGSSQLIDCLNWRVDNKIDDILTVSLLIGPIGVCCD